MRYRTLGRTGMSVSEVSLGGAYLKGPDPERHEEHLGMHARPMQVGDSVTERYRQAHRQAPGSRLQNP